MLGRRLGVGPEGPLREAYSLHWLGKGCFRLGRSPGNGMRKSCPKFPDW